MRNKIFNSLIAVSLIVSIIAGLIAFTGFKTYFLIKKEMREVSSEVMSDNSINFDKLQKINPDIIAWIEIPGTTISYPVVRAKSDNNYYLSHDIHKKTSKYGAIFTDYRLYEETLTAPNVIIYGHNMGRHMKVMFSTLMQYLDSDFYAAHKNLYIYTENNRQTFEVISIRQVSNSDFTPYQTKFSSSEDFKTWVIQSMEKSEIECDGADIVENNVKQVVSLSTCTYNNTKLVLVCVKK